MQSLAIYHVLLQSIPGDTGNASMPDQIPVNGWGMAALVVGAFTTGMVTFGKLTLPLITRWVESKAVKNEAEARLAADVVTHQGARDDRLTRMETRLENLERAWQKTAGKIDRNCARTEPPDSDLIKKTKADK